MSYYNDNAFYKYIRDYHVENFEYVAGDLWQLVYGDSSCNPKLLVLASTSNPMDLMKDPTAEEELAFKRLKEVARKADLPKLFIRFDATIQELDSIMIMNIDGFKKYPINSLTKHFSAKGLPVNDTSTVKKINDKSSSAYQNWQRSHLGRDLKVSDIDLFKLDEMDTIQTIFELKRSESSVNKWNPYPVDYNNYRLIGNLCVKANIEFKIGYNRRAKEPFSDDISNILTFDVAIKDNNPIFTNRTYFRPHQFFE